ncbi:hypothetical protein ACFLYG_01925 [Chloroflexota bacterium]
MRELINRILFMPIWVKIVGGILLAVAIAAIAILLIFGARYLPERDIEWVEQPVMLRLLRGEVIVNTTLGGELIGSEDKTWLNTGNYIKVGENSTILLQYFDGSLIKVKGPAELVNNWSRSIKDEDLDKGRSISLAVLQGIAYISATEQTDSDSLFEVITPSSVGVAQGTVFKVVVKENSESIWVICEGIVRVGSITQDGNLGTVILLKPMSPGDAIAVPPLPEEWHEAPSISEKMITITRDIVQMSVKKGYSNVQTESASLLIADPEFDLAVLQVKEETKPTIPTYTPELPHNYKVLDYEILMGAEYNVVFAKTPSILKPIFPLLPVPDVWRVEKPEMVREVPPGYLSSIMDISKPLGIAVDASGDHIFVVQGSGNRNTLVFDDKGNRIMTLAPPNTTSTERAPSYVAIDCTGTIYVSDRIRHTIDMYDEESVYLGIFTPKNNPDISWSPLGLATDDNGNLYVTDVSDTKHRIIAFNSSGEQIFEFGQSGRGAGSFSFPNDVAVDGLGRIFVADSNNQRIQVINSAGELIGNFASGGGEAVGFPRGIDIEEKYLYVVDTFDHKVKVYDIEQQMKPVFNFGGQGTGNGLFNFPNGLAIDTVGRIYVTDRENNRIQILGY